MQNVWNDPQLRQQMPGVVATINGQPIQYKELAEECLLRHGEQVLMVEISHLLLQQALAKQKDNLTLFRTYCRILYESKKYTDLMNATRAIAQGNKGPWWVYEYRGKAQRAVDLRTEAMNEFNAGIEVATTNRDDEALASLVDTIASEIGIPQAKARIYELAE